MGEIELIFWGFNRTDFRSLGVARLDASLVYTYANAYSDRNKSHDNRLIKDKIRIKILKLLANASKKSNIREENDDFSELLRAIIYTVD